MSRSAVISITTPMSPPPWALLERELIRANNDHTRVFFDRYFDERGYLLCVERWGALDGPDDAIENFTNVPALYLIGGSDDLVAMCRKAQEGHLRQYTEAKTEEVAFAREGMYFREFPVMFDWAHHQEGNAVTGTIGLCDPGDDRHIRRLRRFAGFYMEGDDLPGQIEVPNWDPEHRLIRSMFNGSRGSLLRRTTPLDWAGDRIEDGRFILAHGERNYQDMLDHYIGYEDVAGDHPLNLAATCMAFNAYVHTKESRYKDWLLEYADAWVERTRANGGIIPSNIGLDGAIGGAAGGRWWGGVYGWAHTTITPHTGEPKSRLGVARCLDGFGNALMLTGDRRYLEPWRTTLDGVNANSKVIDGARMYPRMHNDDGWYEWETGPYDDGALDIYYWSMDEADRGRVNSPWIDFMEGNNPGYPDEVLQRDIGVVRQKVQDMYADPTTPDTRLSDNPNSFRPATVDALVELTMGGVIPRVGRPLHTRLRYFDPRRARPGLPTDVGALVEGLTAEETRVRLVNVNQLEPRAVVLQGGTYGEHQWTSVRVDGGDAHPVKDRVLTVHLAPGAGACLTIGTSRYANDPTGDFPF